MAGRYIECDRCQAQQRIGNTSSVFNNEVRDALVARGWQVSSNSRNESEGLDLCPSCSQG